MSSWFGPMGLPELKLLAMGIFTVGMLLDSSESKIFFSHHKFEKFSKLKFLKSLILRTGFMAKLTNLKLRYETQNHISDGDFKIGMISHAYRSSQIALSDALINQSDEHEISIFTLYPTHISPSWT
ncbi:MAG: hypothetical protein IPK55_14980 [Streptococcus sp.]|nr:hypothetical protein [Streptococcus sp.]